jgi:hypothetical protein
MDIDEALAHVEDATPHEDVEAWIAKILAAEVRRLQPIEQRARHAAESGHGWMPAERALARHILGERIRNDEDGGPDR